MMKRLLFISCTVALLALSGAPWAQASVTLNSTNFPDDNFRAALSAYATNGVIDETQLTELDVSNQGITSIKGIELLTALTKFVAAHNDIKFANITNNPHLEWLDLSYNSSLKGFNSTSGSGNTSTNWITLTNNMPLTHLDLSNCNIGYFQAIYNGYHVNTLTWLSLANNPAMDGWSSGITAQSGLVYCDLTNTKQTNNTLGFTSAHNRLETLILKDNAINASVTCLQYLPTLKYLDLSNTGQPQSSTLGITSIHTNLETLKLNGNSNFGWSSSLQYLSSLKYLDISHCDLYFRGDGHLLDYLTSSNNPNLETLIANNSQMGPYTEGLTGFSNLKTVDISGNPNVIQFWVNGSPLLETLDLHGNTGLKILGLENGGYPRTNLTIDDSNCNALTGLKLNNNGYGSVALAMSNATAWGLDNIQFLYLESNSGFSGGPFTMGANDCGNLHGLDLGNNGFTSFTAESLPQSLTALMIGANPSLKRLEMHNNPGIKTMTSDPVMTDGSGLYLLGNTALHYMDISGTANQPNYFQRIGNNFSLQGVPIDTLKASHNKFYTFRNLIEVPGDIYEYWGEKYVDPADGKTKYKNVYHMSTAGNLENAWRYKAYWPTMEAMPDSASLEQLPNLRYLDLSHCQLKDSVYLHKNTDLRYLDVSHNRNIIRSFDSSSSNSKYAKAAAFRAYISNSQNSSTDFADYKKYMWLVTNTDIREYYTNDCNDTIGLYILDLLDNNKLEYLDVSYTGIEQTALTHGHVSNARYIWIQDLPELKYFYADYNGMRSMGIGTQNGKKREGDYTPTAALKSLERLSVIGMRGTDNTTMQGSINFRENTLCTKLHYINLAYGRFDSIGVYIPTVDTLILRGNPLHYVNMQKADNITYLDVRECAFKTRGYDVETEDMFFPNVNIYKNGARIGGQYYGNSTNIPAANPTYTGDLTTPFSGLRGVKAYKRNHLTTVLLDNCNALTNVYCHDDPLLPKIHGFDNLAFNQSYDATYNFPTTDADSLTLVYVQNNKVFNELNLTKNNNLKYLHAYNDSTLGTTLGGNGLDLTANKNLVSAWVSNSRLERFVNDAGQHLDTLKIWQNPELDHLDVSDNGNLRYFDLHNCMVRNLDVSNNTQLRHFDCSNQDSIWTNYDHFNFDMPGEVPTVVNDPGKNSIADLHFGSKVLEVVHADNNDLYCMDGLNNNPNLQTLTYSYNHINGIDLSGCPNITNYNCHHNVRGLIPGELATWSTTENGVTTIHELYYLQLKPNAGDGLDGNDTFLGNKCGQDSLLSDQVDAYQRRLIDDGFDPDKVIEFTVNSSGPHIGTRGQNSASGAPMRADMVEPGTTLDPESFYGKIAIIKRYDRVRNYVYYTYDDGRPNSSSRGGSGFGLAWGPPPGATDVRETTADGMGELTVVSERYYDAAGAEHSEPIDGVNIIVRQMSDGSTQTVKIIK